jgi:hypothetical protein
MPKKKVKSVQQALSFKDRVRRVLKFELFANLLFFLFGLVMLCGYKEHGDPRMLIIGFFLLAVTPISLYMFKRLLDS